jgi:hypothetical protein
MYAWTGSAWGSISSSSDIYRYRYTAAGGETSKSGPDDNGLTLSYIVGKEQVYLNGVLLVRTSDYTATNGSSITSLAALAAGDILEIITFTSFEVANVISPTVIDAKGDLIAGTSADVVGKLTVGTDGQYLQADSSTATGLKWSTVTGYSAPTLGSTSIASGATVTNISGLTLTDPTVSGTLTVGLGGKITQTSASHVIIEGVRLPTNYVIEFEGSTNDAFETLLGVVDPTADRTINLPDASGTIALDATITDLQTMTLMGAL